MSAPANARIRAFLLTLLIACACVVSRSEFAAVLRGEVTRSLQETFPSRHGGKVSSSRGLKEAGAIDSKTGIWLTKGGHKVDPCMKNALVEFLTPIARSVADLGAGHAAYSQAMKSAGLDVHIDAFLIHGWLPNIWKVRSRLFRSEKKKRPALKTTRPPPAGRRGFERPGAVLRREPEHRASVGGPLLAARPLRAAPPQGQRLGR